MNLFRIDHEVHGSLVEGKCKQCRVRSGRKDPPAINNHINLDMLTEVKWEDGMWIVFFGAIYYRIHDKDNMLLLEEVLELDRPTE